MYLFVCGGLCSVAFLCVCSFFSVRCFAFFCVFLLVDVNPYIISLSSRSNSGIYNVGNTIDLIVTFNEPILYLPDAITSTNININDNKQTNVVDSKNAPSLLLNTGGIATFIGYAQQNTNMLLFRYKIGIGEYNMKTNNNVSIPLDVLDSKSFITNGYSFYDNHGNVANDLNIPCCNNRIRGTLPSSVQIMINGNGVKFPPFLYDHTVSPATYANRNNHSTGTSVAPTVIQVLLYVNDLFHVDSGSQSYKMDIITYTRWYDPRLSLSNSQLQYPDTYDSKQLSQIWHPYLSFVNILSAPIVLSQRLLISSDGQVTYIKRQIVTLHSHMNSKNFPFDTEILHVMVNCGISEFAHSVS